MKAWLATWEGTEEDGSKVAFILPPRWSADRIKEYTTWFYVLHGSNLVDQYSFAKHPKQTPYPAEYAGHPQLPQVKWQGRIVCGHNPYLKVRKVNDLEVINDRQVNWQELPEPKLSPETIKLVRGD